MKKSNVIEFSDRIEDADPLTEMLRAGAKELIHHTVDAELQELLAQHGERKTATGTAEVVRNGYHPERDIQTGIGPVTVKIPKVRSKSGEPVRID